MSHHPSAMAGDNWECSCICLLVLISLISLTSGQHVSHAADISSVSSVSVESVTVDSITNSHDSSSQVSSVKNEGQKTTAPPAYNSTEVHTNCPDGVECSELGGDCLDCDFDFNCTYGRSTTAMCKVKSGIRCKGEINFTKSFECRYCYQVNDWLQMCTINSRCQSVHAPPQTYIANCTVKDDVICLGHRKFYKRLPCNWTSGYRWSTALALSITLGGFGVDRFYLGLWRHGIGKLFSFGGLGVWTLVDVILIATGYVGPADGSLYIF